MLAAPFSGQHSAHAALWKANYGAPAAPAQKPKTPTTWGIQPPTPAAPNMSLSKPRYMTLVHGDMETVRIMPSSYADAEALAREWTQPPADAAFALRVPVEYASLLAARLVQGPYLWVANDETWQIATQGVQGIRLEIVSDAPPPPPKEPPPPPVLEMPAAFNLELKPGQTVALDVICSSDDLDMSKTDDGTIVDGTFWGKLHIVHSKDKHEMEFSGSRNKDASLPEDFLLDARMMSRIAVAARQTPIARCHISILAPSQQYCDLYISLSRMWNLGVTYPQAEPQPDGRAKFFVRAHPSGYLEHFHSETVVTSLYYEVMPEQGAEATSYVNQWNGFALPLAEFVPHLYKVLETLGLTIHQRTNFISQSFHSFAAYKHIAYRFMSPDRLAAAITLSVTTDPCVWTRVFLLWRGVPDDEIANFANAGEKEALACDWRGEVNWAEASKDSKNFRVLEMSVMECI